MKYQPKIKKTFLFETDALEFMQFLNETDISYDYLKDYDEFVVSFYRT